MANGQAQQRARSVAELFVVTGIEVGQSVGIFNVDGFAALRHLAGNAAPHGHANFLMIKARGDNRPKLIALAVYQKNRAAVGLDLSPRDLEDQLQELSQIKSGVEQASSFKEQRELRDSLAAL